MKLITDIKTKRIERNNLIRETYSRLMKTEGAQSTAVIDAMKTLFILSEPTIRRALIGITRKNKSKKLS